VRLDWTTPQITLQSNARLRPGKGRWYHIAVSREAQKDRSGSVGLYINGVLDAKAEVKGMESPQPSSVFIGGFPWRSQQYAGCHVPILMDDLTLYSRSLNVEEIQASSFGALGAIPAATASLACDGCKCQEAQQTCKDRGAHLCSDLELEGGAYSLAMLMGWIELGGDVLHINMKGGILECLNGPSPALCCESR